jgi:hypothetical protein
MTTVDPSSPLSPVYQSPWVDPKSGQPYSPLTNLGSIKNPPASWSILDLFNTLGRPDFWIRTGIFGAGVGLLIVGIVVLVSSSKIAGEALSMAGQAAKLTPAGAAASVASEAISA